jgi:hypothetical protein
MSASCGSEERFLLAALVRNDSEKQKRKNKNIKPKPKGEGRAKREIGKG